MKIKSRPEDFVVSELDRFDLSTTGAFSLYRLEKWDIGTLEALGSLAKSWNLSRAQISFGGLKDRHARTEQMISIRGGPERTFETVSTPGIRASAADAAGEKESKPPPEETT